jgi:hypothetical protein
MQFPESLESFLFAAARYLNALAEERERAAAPSEPKAMTPTEKAWARFDAHRAKNWDGGGTDGLRAEEVRDAIEALLTPDDGDPEESIGLTREEAQEILERHDVPRSIWRG